MRVRIRGVIYESEQEAADAFGVKREHIVSMVSRCREDFIGSARSKHKRVGGKKKTITIGGVDYSSLSAASVALGFRKNRLTEIMSKKKSGELEKIVEILKERGSLRPDRRVTVQGVTYESLKEAAAAFNIHPETLSRRITNRTEDTLEVTPVADRRGRPQPVILDGVTFANAREATKALGFKHNYISYAMGRFKDNATVQAKVAAAVRAYKEKKE